jgi:hypothetical protein
MLCNLLGETVEVLRIHDYHLYDVAWIGTKDSELGLTIEEFISRANVCYESGVDPDLVMVMNDGTFFKRSIHLEGENWAHSNPVSYISPHIRPSATLQGLFI